ncbi:MAG: dihydrolipoyl dehydrogenase [Saprospiraceae bacterium]
MQYDVIIIGSGPGGYVCAIRCAQLGLKTAIIEKYDTLGGTCLNVGCIPSKALLDSSEHFHQAKTNFAAHGIIATEIGLDLPKMIGRKNEVVEQTCKGVDFLMKKNKIDVFHGLGTLVDKNTVKITKEGTKEERISGKNIVLATGSKPVTPALFNYDKDRIITSTEALQIKELPKKMVIIGAGVIGLELGSVYARLGTEVTVVEYLDRILTGMDADCSKELQRSLKKLGIIFHLNHQVSSVKSAKGIVTVIAKSNAKPEQIELKADYCLIAIGRRAYSEGLGLESVGIKLDERGRIPVNHELQSSVEGIWAIGDLIEGAMLAHKAEDEGTAVAERIAGQKPHIDYNLIPGVVYTWPELASVGRTEEQLKAEEIPYKVGKFPFKALGRARASMDTEGLVKILADEQSDEILGVHILGPRAADMIAEAVLAMEFRASAEDIARSSHAHPTYTEAIREAALDATGRRAIHM